MADLMASLAPEPTYAVALANDSYEWYKEHAIRARRAYKVSETTILILSAAIPASAVLAPHDARVPAVLGAMVVILAGLRSVFHWHDNYLRFSGGREAIEAERRLYYTNARPYNDQEVRDQILAAAVTRIEQEEMSGWIKIAAERPKP